MRRPSLAPGDRRVRSTPRSDLCDFFVFTTLDSIARSTYLAKCDSWYCARRHPPRGFFVVASSTQYRLSVANPIATAESVQSGSITVSIAGASIGQQKLDSRCGGNPPDSALDYVYASLPFGSRYAIAARTSVGSSP